MKSIKCFFEAYKKQFFSYLNRPLNIFDNWALWGRLNWMPDRLYLSLKFRSLMGYWMNWKNPKTFNEKLQWLKIHDRNPLYTKLVDKYEVRKYISEKIGEEHLVPLLGIWDNPEDVDFFNLPNQFVLKCTHDSASIIICKDKSKFDIDAAKQKMRNHMSINYYYPSREWPYKNVRPRIIAEKYINDADILDLKDYKFQVFNGIVQNCFVCSNRFMPQGLHVTFFDKNWKALNFTKHYPKESVPLKKPFFFKEMVAISEQLSKDFPFVRVDFFETSSNFFIGELTFYPGAGFEKFTPSEWDLKMGSLLKIDQGFNKRRCN